MVAIIYTGENGEMLNMTSASVEHFDGKIICGCNSFNSFTLPRTIQAEGRTGKCVQGTQAYTAKLTILLRIEWARLVCFGVSRLAGDAMKIEIDGHDLRIRRRDDARNRARPCLRAVDGGAPAAGAPLQHP